jgi:hypothetical protein
MLQFEDARPPHMRRAAARTPRRRARRLATAPSLRDAWQAKHGTPRTFDAHGRNSFGTRAGDFASLLWADRRWPLGARAVDRYWRSTSNWLGTRLERWFACHGCTLEPAPWYDAPHMTRFRYVRAAYAGCALDRPSLDGIRFVRARCADPARQWARRRWKAPWMRRPSRE